MSSSSYTSNASFRSFRESPVEPVDPYPSSPASSAFVSSSSPYFDLNVSTTHSWSQWVAAHSGKLLVGSLGSAALVAWIWRSYANTASKRGKQQQKRRNRRPQPLPTERRQAQGKRAAARGRSTAAGLNRGRQSESNLADLADEVEEEDEEEEEEEELVRTPVGVRNVGQTCFLSTVLQFIQGSEPFVAYITQLHSIAAQQQAVRAITMAASHGKSNSAADSFSSSFTSSPSSSPSSASSYLVPGLTPDAFLDSLLSLLRPDMSSSLSSSSSVVVDPSSFLHLLIRASFGKFAQGDQEDAHELLHVLYEVLERCETILKNNADAMEMRMQMMMMAGKASMNGSAKRRISEQQGIEALLGDEDEEVVATADAEMRKQAQSDKDGPRMNGIVSKNHVGKAKTLAEDDDISGALANHEVNDHANSTTASQLTNGIEKQTDTSSGIKNGISSASTTLAVSTPSAIPSLPKSLLSFPMDPLGGLLCQFLQCQVCRTLVPPIKTTPFSSITLHLAASASASVSRSHSVSMEELMRAFVGDDVVEGVKCESCRLEALRKDLLSMIQKAERTLNELEEELYGDGTNGSTNKVKSKSKSKSKAQRRKQGNLLLLLHQLLEDVQYKILRLRPTDTKRFLAYKELLEYRRNEEEQEEENEVEKKKEKNGADGASHSTKTTSSSSASSTASSLVAGDSFLNIVAPIDPSLSLTSSASDIILTASIPRSISSPSSFPSSPGSMLDSLQSFLASGSDLDSSLYPSPHALSTTLRGSLLRNVVRRFVKSCSILRAPPTMCFHINRLTMTGTKSSALVSFPLRLAMDPYMTNRRHATYLMDVSRSTTGSENIEKFGVYQKGMMERQGVKDGKSPAGMGSSFSFPTPTPFSRPTALYELVAVAVHQGSARGGHWVAYRREVQMPKRPKASRSRTSQSTKKNHDRNGNGNGNGHTNVHVNGEENGMSCGNSTTHSDNELTNGHDLASSTSVSSSSLFSLDPLSASSSSLPSPSSSFSSSASSSPSPSPTPSSSSSSSQTLPGPGSGVPIVRWWYFSDANYREASETEVLNAEASLLLYSRVDMSRM